MKKLQGTTLLIGVSPLEIKHGTFQAYVYQDIIDKKYIIALVYGSLDRELYIRIHSSCLTSETLRSMDCDCVAQLDGALHQIAQHGTGILFYLMQSGRGASYIAKSRGCQLVQHLQDQISTFEAYEQMGLQHDYRDYRNVKDICLMLGVEQHEFVLMTNNPDKIQKLQGLDLRLRDIVSIEYPPNPFNQKYLLSKQQTGHLLVYTKKKVRCHTEDQPSVAPFEPYHLPGLERFIHCSSYYLPIQPVDHQVIVDLDIYRELITRPNLVQATQKLNATQYLVQLSELPEDQCLQPYWFRMHVYYDLAQHEEMLILTYGDPSDRSTQPVVRLHTEFIFNRFPLQDTFYQRRYERALLEIVRNGSGAIAILNHNGTNQTLGRYLLDHQPFEVSSISTKKNLQATMMLLQHHLKGNPAWVYYAINSRAELESAFQKGEVPVAGWLCSEEDDRYGHQLIRHRIQEAVHYVSHLPTPEPLQLATDRVVVTGIGTSRVHGEFLVYLLQQRPVMASFVPIDYFTHRKLDPEETLIIISQGLSPHILETFQHHPHLILLTAVTPENPDPVKRQHRIDFPGRVIQYPLEDEYTTLIRTIGPMCGFGVIYQLVTQKPLPTDLSQILTQVPTPPPEFINHLAQEPRLVIVGRHPETRYLENLRFKLLEGAFLDSVEIVDQFQLGHGIYQWSEHHRLSERPVSYLALNLDAEILTFLQSKYQVYAYQTSLEDELRILEIEQLGNHLMHRMVVTTQIDQKDWPGRSDQDRVYRRTPKTTDHHASQNSSSHEGQNC